MIIRFSKDLSKQEISANGYELAQVMGLDKDEKGNRIISRPKEEKKHIITFENPVLVTDNYRIAKTGEEDSTKRDTLFSLFSSGFKIIEYDNISLEFDQKKYKGVWGPSIDTLLFTRALSKIDLKKIKSAIEVGAGSAFISKYILKNAPDLEAMTLIDLNKNSLDCAIDNIDDGRASFYVGDAIRFLDEKKYDIIACNPPYTPRPKSIDDNPYEGLQLLNYLIANSSKNLSKEGFLLTNFSSLSADTTYRFCEESGCSVKEIDSMRVPFKVNNVLNNKEWMEYLTDERGLKKERREGYDYWHDITIVRVQPK